MPNWELENVKGITDAQVQNNMPLTLEKRKERGCLHTQSTHKAHTVTLRQDMA